jgi:hypothetical protein
VTEAWENHKLKQAQILTRSFMVAVELIPAVEMLMAA